MYQEKRITDGKLCKCPFCGCINNGISKCKHFRFLEDSNIHAVTWNFKNKQIPLAIKEVGK